MVHNIVSPMISRPELTLARYDVHHALPNTANTLIGKINFIIMSQKWHKMLPFFDVSKT